MEFLREWYEDDKNTGKELKLKEVKKLQNQISLSFYFSLGSVLPSVTIRGMKFQSKDSIESTTFSLLTHYNASLKIN